MDYSNFIIAAYSITTLALLGVAIQSISYLRKERNLQKKRDEI